MLTARVIKLHNLGPLLVFAVLSYGVLFEPQLVMGPEATHALCALQGLLACSLDLLLKHNSLFNFFGNFDMFINFLVKSRFFNY